MQPVICPWLMRISLWCRQNIPVDPGVKLKFKLKFSHDVLFTSTGVITFFDQSLTQKVLGIFCTCAEFPEVKWPVWI